MKEIVIIFLTHSLQKLQEFMKFYFHYMFVFLYYVFHRPRNTVFR